MAVILLVAGSAVAYLIAYHTYGKFLAGKIFALDKTARTPAVALEDNNDYVPTKKEILFGHHYTSIAGTGPIVGPALGIIWGWLPALLWVVFGSIFMGAVHDFGALVVSMRHQGRSIGDVAAHVISKRVRVMFLTIIFLTLLIVIAIFCLVIAKLFDLYPQSILSIWFEIPLALWLGYIIYVKKRHALLYSLLALALLYLTVVLGSFERVYSFFRMGSPGGMGPVVIWSIILLVYAYIASILPVWRLLQPRDYINGHELFVAMGLLAIGTMLSHPAIVAPAINLHPAGAPPMLPFLFITIACGAISGFHALVASGTTSKQLSGELDAKAIGYGSMLTEGMLAVFVIIAVGAGIGMATGHSELSGVAAWQHHYASWKAAEGLGPGVSAFVNGAANLLTGMGIPFGVGITIMGVFVASFAGTTLDTATRLQRYAVAELAGSLGIKPLTNKYIATAVAVISAGVLALHDGKGAGGMLLWPLFGATNQLLAALALLVVTVYLARKNKPVIFTVTPFLLMLVMTGWAMIMQIERFFSAGTLHLAVIGAIIIILEVWMVIEALLIVAKSRQPVYTRH